MNTTTDAPAVTRFRTSIGAVQFSPSTVASIRHAVRAHGATDAPLVIGYVNPHVAVMAARNDAVARHLASADHVCVDGIGVALVLRVRRHRVERVPAHRVFDLLLRDGSLQGTAVVIGIEPDAIASAAAAIGARSELDPIAVVDGFATLDEIGQVLTANRSADVVLIGAGTPRSEEIVLLAAGSCHHAIIVHCGAGTLKVFAGDRQHAPQWISRVGMDWLYRFVAEPHTRQRYTTGLVAFARLVVVGSPGPNHNSSGSPEERS